MKKPYNQGMVVLSKSLTIRRTHGQSFFVHDSSENTSAKTISVKRFIFTPLI